MKVGKFGPRERAATLDALAKAMPGGWGWFSRRWERGCDAQLWLLGVFSADVVLSGGAFGPSVCVESRGESRRVVDPSAARGMTVEALAVAISDALVAEAARGES